MNKQLCFLIRLLLVISLLFSTFSSSIQAKDYFFMADEDNFYVNPANWYPIYPGIKIQEGDKVFIQEDVFFEGIRLELLGTLEIMLGAEITSSDGEILIRESGKINNFGIVRIEGIRNFGNLTNNVGSVTQLKFYTAHRKSMTDNMSSANFVVAGDAVNIGLFNNYGYCSVGHDLFSLEESIFNQLKKSELVVRGTLQTYASSVMNHSESSVFEIYNEVKLKLANEAHEDAKLKP